jgi:hypothetical protein
MSRSRFCFVVALVSVFGLAAHKASADVVTIGLDTLLSGTVASPNSPGAWITATFSDTSTAGVVQMVLSGANLNRTNNSGGAGSGYQHAGNGMLGWYFNPNFGGALSASFVSKHVDPHATGLTNPTITFAGNFNSTIIGGTGSTSGKYTMNVQFVEGDANSEFQYGDSITYNISGTGLTAADFMNKATDGTHYSAAYIEDGSNGWITATSATDNPFTPAAVPEPSTLLVALLAAPAFVGFIRSRRKRGGAV